MQNWAGNVTFGAQRLHRPTSVPQIQALVAGSEHIRAIGTGHSFSAVADCSGDLISLAGLPRTVQVDLDRATATVSGGARYADVVGPLHEQGFALHNLGSLPHINVAGACATGTHGSGRQHRNLATAVRRLQMVGADGDLVALDREADCEIFGGAVLALGTLGIVTSLTLDLVPTFQVSQQVYELPAGEFREQLDEILGAAYSVSVFTYWQDAGTDQVWVKRRSTDPWRDVPGVPATSPRHPVPGMPVVHCTQQLGAPGPWHERLPHFRREFTPSSGDELQSEYLVPRDQAQQALTAVQEIRDLVVTVLQVSEIRTVAADDLWLSPSYRRDCLAIHFTWVNNTPAVLAVLAVLEAQLAPFAARPHWGKVFGIAPEVLAGCYERQPDFARLRHRFDPGNTFGNQLVDRYLHG